MNCIADIHYEIVKDDFGIKALACKFCGFMVTRNWTPKPRSSRSGLGRYNRMRGKMVKHLHAEHREQLAATSPPLVAGESEE
jgi:hypothetical protein